MLNQEIVNEFIIETVLISPIKVIIQKLNTGDFRDCDIKWLDAKLAAFIAFAGETLDIKVPVRLEENPYTHFNAYVTNVYLEKFNTLLRYFTYLKNDEEFNNWKVEDDGIIAKFSNK